MERTQLPCTCALDLQVRNPFGESDSYISYIAFLTNKGKKQSRSLPHTRRRRTTTTGTFIPHWTKPDSSTSSTGNTYTMRERIPTQVSGVEGESGEPVVKSVVSCTRRAAAVLYFTLQGVAHIGRHLPIGVTYKSIEIPGECYIMSSCLHTGALLELLDFVLIYLSRRSPPTSDVPSEGRIPACLSVHTVESGTR